MCEGGSFWPYSCGQLQSWQQPPPKQTQTTGVESSGQPPGPGQELALLPRPKHKSTCYRASHLLPRRNGRSVPARMHLPCRDGREGEEGRKAQRWGSDVVSEGQRHLTPTESIILCAGPFTPCMCQSTIPYPQPSKPDVFQNPDCFRF